MAVYRESGLSLDLPDGQHFRFADLGGYRELSGQHLKEMDFAWVNGGKLFLLEVRSYLAAAETATFSAADFVPAQATPAPRRFADLLAKVTDSVMMMLAVWADSTQGGKIAEGMPPAARQRLPLKLVIALDLPPALACHLQPLSDGLNSHLRGRIALADVKSVAVVDYGRLVTDTMFRNFIKRE